MKAKVTAGSKNYDAEAIDVLEGLEAVRKRPGMYIGTTGTEGYHLIREIVDNSVDEAMAGFASRIDITIHKDGSVTVMDDGRGIPVDKHKKTGLSALETVMTTLHAGENLVVKDIKFRWPPWCRRIGSKRLSVWTKVEVRRTIKYTFKITKEKKL